MKPITTIFTISVIATLSYFSISCGSKSEDPGTATIKFSAASASYAEDRGAINISATLSTPQSADVIVNYSWSSLDTTTYLGGDFNFLTPTSFTIKAGQTEGNLQIQSIDDVQIDTDDNITFTLSGVSAGNASISSIASETTFKLTLINNDVATTNALQADLTWHTSNNTSNINDVNLDLYLQQNVTYDAYKGAITDPGTVYASSKNSTGYETLSLKSSDKDQDYFLVINYTTGSSLVTYVLTLNGFGYSNNSASGKLRSLDSGYALFYGPFTKSGSSFGRSVPPRFYRVNK